jgi:hypothetical protein
MNNKLPTCRNCYGEKLVCENHPDAPWNAGLPFGCECGAGMPCGVCDLEMASAGYVYMALENRRASQAHTDGLVAERQAIVADLVDLYQRRVQSRKGKRPNNNDQFLMAIAQRIAGVSPLEDPLTAAKGA